jgi:nucleotide-binding universal stress UspA family protein
MTESGRKSQIEPLKLRGSEPLERVLIAVDLTSISDRVLSRVALLPLSTKALVTVFHVVPDELPHLAQQRALRDARKAVREEVAHLRALLPKGAHAEGRVEVGNGAKTIAQTARSLRAELIVMGRGSGSGKALRDTFLGSTAERVIRLGKLPVLTVRLRGRAPYRRPAIALDFDESAPAVIAWTRRILAPSPSPMTVIHAVDTPYRGIAYPSLSEDDAESFASELEQKAVRKIVKLFNRGDAERSRALLQWKPHVRCGSSRLVIAKAVKKAENDLLVLGTHGHSGLAYVVLGSVAGDVLREVACDVLVVPPKHKRALSRA